MTTQNETPTLPALPEPTEANAADIAPENTLESGVDWAREAGEMGDLEGLETVEGDVEVLEAPVAEETPPAPAIAAASAAPVAEVPAAAQPVEAQPVPAAQIPQTPAAAPVIPAAPAFDMVKWEKEQLGDLEKLYAISAEDAEKLNTEPELILPKLAANMHMSVTKALLTAVQDIIPVALAQHTQQVSVEQEARNSFYAVNPDLNDPKYEAAIFQVGKIFRAANPAAPREVAVKTIGDMVRQALQIAPISAPAATPAPQPAPVAKPFTPAKGGGQRAVPKASTIWDEMISDN